MSYYTPPSDPYQVSYSETPSTYQTSYPSPAYSSTTSYASYSSPYDQSADYYLTTASSRRSSPRSEYYDDKYYDDEPSPSLSRPNKKRISASGLSPHLPPSSEYRRPTSTSTSSKRRAPRLPPPEPERRSKPSKSGSSSRALVVAPRSPEITRLGTPDVGDVEHGRFCGCCPPMEERDGYEEEEYADRRGKMDGQLSTAKAYISKKKGGRLLEYH